jgi:hypothetical protein
MIRASQKSLTGDATDPSSRELAGTRAGVANFIKTHAPARLYKSLPSLFKPLPIQSDTFPQGEGLNRWKRIPAFEVRTKSRASLTGLSTGGSKWRTAAAAPFRP